MKEFPGVTTAKKKDGTVYYRSSVTERGRHISLGSYDQASDAAKAYREAVSVLRDHLYALSDYSDTFSLPFCKFVILMNLRDNGIYSKTPIYLYANRFHYYLAPDQYLIFDREDFFFYAIHPIQQRGGYYFVSDYGSQYSILSRFGIHSYARKGVDYLFVNHNDRDFRYENIRVINGYRGVTELTDTYPPRYECRIHIRGNVLVGRYRDRITAAIAYNKAADCLIAKGSKRKYIRNYIHEYDAAQYLAAYQHVVISDTINNYDVIGLQKQIEESVSVCYNRS